MELEAETAYFEKHRAEWLKDHQGKYVAIRGTEVAGFFSSDTDAYKAGLDRWGVVPMLIKQILPEDRVEQIPSFAYGLLDANL